MIAHDFWVIDKSQENIIPDYIRRQADNIIENQREKRAILPKTVGFNSGLGGPARQTHPYANAIGRRSDLMDGFARVSFNWGGSCLMARIPCLNVRFRVQVSWLSGRPTPTDLFQCGADARAERVAARDRGRCSKAGIRLK